MPHMTTRTLIHTYAHLQHGTMTGHNEKTVTAAPRSVRNPHVFANFCSSRLKCILFFILLVQTLQCYVLLGGRGVVCQVQTTQQSSETKKEMCKVQLIHHCVEIMLLCL